MDRTISDNRHAPTSPMYNSNATNFHAGKMPFSRDGGHDRVAVLVPDAPPYRAYIGTVSYDLTEEAVEAFLGHRRVVEILITRYREDPGRAKSCFVEFAEREDLVRRGLDFGGRSVGRSGVPSVVRSRVLSTTRCLTLARSLAYSLALCARSFARSRFWRWTGGI